MKEQSDAEYLEEQLWKAFDRFLAEGGDLKDVCKALGQESSLYYNRNWKPADVIANLLCELRGLGETENLANRFRNDPEAQDYYLPGLLAEYSPGSLD